MLHHAVEIDDMTLDIFDERFNWYRVERLIARNLGERDALNGARMVVSETRASRTYLFYYPAQGTLGDLRVDQVTPTRIKVQVMAKSWAAEHWAPPLVAWLDGLAETTTPTPAALATSDLVCLLRAEVEKIVKDTGTSAKYKVQQIDQLYAPLGVKMEAEELGNLLHIAPGTVYKYRQL